MPAGNVLPLLAYANGFTRSPGNGVPFVKEAALLFLAVPADLAIPWAPIAVSFNEMAAGLSLADSRRRQWTTDVAHELRSPLTSVRSHLDAMADGLIEADAEGFAIFGSEVDRLAHLTDDLQTIASLDEHSLRLDPIPTDVVGGG